MGVDSESFSDVLKHPIRRKVILVLSERNVSYTDLMGAVEAANTGKFNYHLKILGDLIAKDNDCKYVLTEKGKLAAEFLQKFPEKRIDPKPLRMADALLIGFVGFAVTLANPAFWVFMAAASWNVQSVPLMITLQCLGIIFSFIVPGAVMWRLAVRRSHSHDAYDLYKAPLLAFVMLLLILIPMVIFRFPAGAQVSIQIGETISSGNIDLPGGATGSWTKSSYSIYMMSLFQFVLYGMFLSFIGVALSEGASRIRRKIKFRL